MKTGFDVIPLVQHAIVISLFICATRDGSISFMFLEGVIPSQCDTSAENRWFTECFTAECVSQPPKELKKTYRCPLISTAFAKSKLAMRETFMLSANAKCPERL